MTVGAALFVIAVGAILRYAVEDSWSAVDLPAVGLILMIVGVVGLAIELWRTLSDRPPAGPPH